MARFSQKVCRYGLVPLLVLCFLLTGCGNKLTKYRKEVTQHVDVIFEQTDLLQETLAKLQSSMADKDSALYEEQLGLLRTECETLAAEYQAIADAKCPDEYAQHQLLLQGYATEIVDALSAMPELYTLAQGAMTTELSDDSIARIGVLQQKVAKAALTADNFDKVLNEVLGYEGEDE